MLDYSVVNEFCRIERPCESVLTLSQQVAKFLHFVQLGQELDTLYTWSEVCASVRLVTSNTFEFKKKIQNVFHIKPLQLFAAIRAKMIMHKMQVRSLMRQSRAFRTLVQLCWVTINEVLNQSYVDDVYGD